MFKKASLKIHQVAPVIFEINLTVNSKVGYFYNFYYNKSLKPFYSFFKVINKNVWSDFSRYL